MFAPVLVFARSISLLTSNTLVQGDHDERLCPDPEISTDGETKLSCNQVDKGAGCRVQGAGCRVQG